MTAAGEAKARRAASPRDCARPTTQIIGVVAGRPEWGA
jgi:hypothetical protein